MVKITVLYPNVEGKRFDMDYYLQVHMPLSVEKQGKALNGVQVKTGLRGASEGTPAPYVAMCHFLYERVDDFLTAFLPHAQLLQDDMIHYTDIESIIQVSQIQIYKIS